MAKVIIAFSADMSEIGKTREVPDEDAVAMVREGRARYTSEKEAASAAKATGTTAPTTAPAG